MTLKHYIVGLIGIVLLIGISGFFLPVRKRALTRPSPKGSHAPPSPGEGSRRAPRQVYLSHRQIARRLIGALLLGNTFVNILASALATEVSFTGFRRRRNCHLRL